MKRLYKANSIYFDLIIITILMIVAMAWFFTILDGVGGLK